METDFIDAQFYLCHNMSFISYKTGSQHGHSRTGKQLPLNSGARATLREIKWAMRADQRSYQDPPNLLVVVHSRLQGTCVNSKMVSCDKGHQRLRPPSSFSAAVNDIFFFWSPISCCCYQSLLGGGTVQLAIIDSAGRMCNLPITCNRSRLSIKGQKSWRGDKDRNIDADSSLAFQRANKGGNLRSVMCGSLSYKTWVKP